MIAINYLLYTSQLFSEKMGQKNRGKEPVFMYLTEETLCCLIS